MVLYSTGCPRCKVLKMKMEKKGLNFEVSTDIQNLIDKGFQTAPALELDDGKILTFEQAVKYVNEAGENK